MLKRWHYLPEDAKSGPPPLRSTAVKVPIMEDKHRKHKSKKSKKRHSDKSKKKHRDKLRKDSSDYEVKTPPLPAKLPEKTIEDLLKKRELLHEELMKIGSPSHNHTNENNQNQNIQDNLASNKRAKHQHDSIIFKKQKLDEPSSKKDESLKLYDSEDEESIIELRRNQRKMLLEKLTPADHPRAEVKKFDDKKNVPSDKSKTVNTVTEKKEGVDDMFSESDFNAAKSIPGKQPHDSTNDSQLNDNWDDPEGYYNIRVGDIINDNRYVIKKVLGQGMFANVVRAQDKFRSTEVAIKIARNNDLMYRNGLKEIMLLKEIAQADPDEKHHCVRLLRHFMHRKHLCIVLESLSMDLRCVMKKFGKNQGMSIRTVVSYSRQLLIALRLLKRIGIMHADVKPDNILVSEDRNTIKLCDFGSAERLADSVDPRPYLVSRFYRAPEIILGCGCGTAADLWAAAATAYEMATARIMFTGGSNNKMLKCFMDIKGKIPNKLIRRGKFKDQHFNYNNNFLLHSKDPVTGREKVSEVTNIMVTRSLQKELKKYCCNVTQSEERKLAQLKDLLDKMLMLEPNQRISVSDCLKHPFIQEPL